MKSGKCYSAPASSLIDKENPPGSLSSFVLSDLEIHNSEIWASLVSVSGRVTLGTQQQFGVKVLPLQSHFLDLFASLYSAQCVPPYSYKGKQQLSPNFPKYGQNTEKRTQQVSRRTAFPPVKCSTCNQLITTSNLTRCVSKQHNFPSTLSVIIFN